MKVTKHKDAEGRYIIRVDGRDTGLVVELSPARKRWGDAQEWDVSIGDEHLFSARGLTQAVQAIQLLADAILAKTA